MRTLPRGALALALASAAASVAPAPAHAQAPRVVLATRDANLETELEATLAPWGIDLIVDEAAPGASMPGSAERSAALASAHDAVAVTWVSRDEDGGFALWIFDRRTARVLARPLPTGPPFDEPTAAAVALSIKTLLRHSDAAPVAERIVDPPLPSEVRFELGAGARGLATSPADAEPRAQVGLSWWPRELSTALGLSLALRSGTGIGVSTPTIAARLGTAEAHLGARLRAVLAPVVDIGVGIELGVTVGWLDATVTADARHVTPVTADATGYLWAELGLRPIPSLRVAIRGGVFTTPRTRTYLVRGEPVLDTNLVAPYGELTFELPLDGGRVDSP